MNNDSVVRYALGDAAVTNVAGDPEEVAVGMNQFGAVRNSSSTLVAAGGPCPVVVLRRADERVGALVHISGENAEQDGNDHVALFARLLEAAPELDAQTQVCICFDPSPAPGLELPEGMGEADVAAQTQTRLAYVEKVEQHLQGLGFADIARLTEGVGKTAYLNAADGVVMFLDEDDNFLAPPDDSWIAPAGDGNGHDADVPAE